MRYCSACAKSRRLGKLEDVAWEEHPHTRCGPRGCQGCQEPATRGPGVSAIEHAFNGDAERVAAAVAAGGQCFWCGVVGGHFCFAETGVQCLSCTYLIITFTRRAPQRAAP